MLKPIFHAMLATTLLAALSACDQIPIPAANPPAPEPVEVKPSVAVLDLIAVAKAVGEDEVVRAQLEQASTSLNQQLSQIAGQLNQQLVEEKNKLGEELSDEDRQKLVRMTAQAQQELRKKQQEARLRGQQFQASLRQKFLAELRPVAAEVARQREASAVMLTSATLLWHDQTVDITGDVISALRAAREKSGQGSTSPSATASDSASGASSQGSQSN